MLKPGDSNAAAPAADPDVRLMLRFQAGEEEAFRELFEKYQRAIVNFAYQFVGSRPRAEELAQDVFLQIYKAAPRYQPQAKFTTWMYRIAKNACLNEVRRPERRYKMRPLEYDTEDKFERAEIAIADENAVRGDLELAGRELETKIHEVLETLPPNQRAALVLSRVEGMSYQEVSEALEITESAVKSLVFRATATMRRELVEFL